MSRGWSIRMLVINQGSWIVNQAISMEDYMQKCYNIFASTGRASSSKSRIETAFAAEKACRKCHTRACTCTAGSCDIGIRGVFLVMLTQVENSTGKSVGETSLSLKEKLCRRLQF